MSAPTPEEIMIEFGKLANLASNPAISADVQRIISLAANALLWATHDGPPLSESIAAEITAVGKT